MELEGDARPRRLSVRCGRQLGVGAPCTTRYSAVCRCSSPCALPSPLPAPPQVVIRRVAIIPIASLQAFLRGQDEELAYHAIQARGGD